MICSYCHKDRDKFWKSGGYTSSKGIFVQKYKCRECNTKHQRNKYRLPNGRNAIVRAIKKYEKLYPERRVAWIAARTIQKGNCIICGDSKSIHKHHPDPYKPLEIISLCPLHHKLIHSV